MQIALVLPTECRRYVSAILMRTSPCRCRERLETGRSSRKITACERREVGTGERVQETWSRRSKVVDGGMAAIKKTGEKGQLVERQ